MFQPARCAGCPSSAVAARWRWRLLALVLAGVVLNIGCGPELLYFLWPQDNKEAPSKCKLTETKKNPKVVLLVSHGSEQTKTPDLFEVDRLLADQLTLLLEKQFKENKDQVTIVPAFKVREYKARTANWETKSPVEIGKYFDADYVISLEINKMNLYKDRSMRQLYEGHAEIGVMVTDVSGAPDKGFIFQDYYRATFPPYGEQAADYSVGIFRASFVGYMAGQLVQWFAAHPPQREMSLPGGGI